MQTKAKLPHLGQEYSSPWDNIYPYSEIGRWVTDTTTGALKYKLDPLDSSKKLDGSPSVLDGTDGDVMVKVPRFGYKVEFNEDGTSNYYITATRPNDSGSNLPLGFKIHPAFRRGDGTFAEYFLYGATKGSVISGQLRSVFGVIPNAIGQTIGTRRTEARNGRSLDFGLLNLNVVSAVQLLFLCEFQNSDSQSVLGKGKSSTNGVYDSTGDSVSIGDKSGFVDTGKGGDGLESVSYRGIEDIYGVRWDFVDGAMLSGDYLYIAEKPEDFGNMSESTEVAVTKPLNSGYAQKMNQIKQIDNIFLPCQTEGTKATYFADFFYSWGTNNIINFGGTPNGDQYNGFFSYDTRDSVAHGTGFGRLCILPKGGN